LRFEVDFLLEWRKRAHFGVDAQDHVAAVTTVTARRSAVWHEFLAPEGDHAVAAAAACYEYFDFIEHTLSTLTFRNAIRLTGAIPCQRAAHAFTKLRRLEAEFAPRLVAGDIPVIIHVGAQGDGIEWLAAGERRQRGHHPRRRD